MTKSDTISVEDSKEPRKLRVGWITYDGFEIFRNRKDLRKNKPPKKLNSILLGDTVYIYTSGVGMRAYKKCKIISKNKDEALAEITKNCYADLKFSKDDRKCWACTGFVVYNTKDILKLNIEI